MIICPRCHQEFRREDLGPGHARLESAHNAFGHVYFFNRIHCPNPHCICWIMDECRPELDAA
jgi:hypothetical protein